LRISDVYLGFLLGTKPKIHGNTLAAGDEWGKRYASSCRGAQLGAGFRAMQQLMISRERHGTPESNQRPLLRSRRNQQLRSMSMKAERPT
jgi:hypothetical protein